MASGSCIRGRRSKRTAAKGTVLAVPPRSPDLNPVEKFWSWLRRELLALDLKDLKTGRPALGKTAFKKRVRSLCRTQKAKLVAQNVARSWRTVSGYVQLAFLVSGS